MATLIDLKWKRRLRGGGGRAQVDDLHLGSVNVCIVSEVHAEAVNNVRWKRRKMPAYWFIAWL